MTIKNKQNNDKSSAFVKGFSFGILSMATFFWIAFYFVNDKENPQQQSPVMTVVDKILPENQNEIIVRDAFNYLDKAFYRDLTDKDVHDFINAGLKSLDKFNGYLPDNRYRALSGLPPVKPVDPSSYKIGIYGTVTDKAFIIEATSPDSPADRAGIRPGDIIIGINNVMFENYTGAEVFKNLSETVKGNPGKEIKITLRRGMKDIEVKLASKNIPPNFTYDLGEVDNIPHILLTGFYPGTTASLKKILEKYEQKGKLGGVVIDLRSNGGGRVDEAEQLASLFMPDGSVIYNSESRIEGNRIYATTGPGPFKNIPVAVLVNNKSASASEITAGFFQGNKRGVVIGQKTYGKGSIQTVIPLKYNGGAVKITMGHYKDAAGHKIHKVGIFPDIITKPQDIQKRISSSVKDNDLILARQWIKDGADFEKLSKYQKTNSTAFIPF